MITYSRGLRFLPRRGPRVRGSEVDGIVTVEIVPFEISNSMKPYPSVFYAYTTKLRPAMLFFEPQKLDGVFKPYSANLSADTVTPQFSWIECSERQSESRVAESRLVSTSKCR